MDNVLTTVVRFGGWVRRSGRLEVSLLLAILCAVIGLWTFIALAEEVVGGGTGKFDEHLLLALRRRDNLAVPIGPAWTLQVARDLTAFGGGVGISLVTGGVAGYLALQRRFGLLSVVLTSIVGGTALTLLLKHLFHPASTSNRASPHGYRLFQLPERPLDAFVDCLFDDGGFARPHRSAI